MSTPERRKYVEGILAAFDRDRLTSPDDAFDHAVVLLLGNILSELMTQTDLQAAEHNARAVAALPRLGFRPVTAEEAEALVNSGQATYLHPPQPPPAGRR